MKIAIIGFEGSGKTSVFETLASSSADKAKNPSQKDERHKPRLGTVMIADDRLSRLSEVYKPKKTTFAELTFIDRPGFDIAHAKDADGLVIVIGAFMGKDPNKELRDVEAEFIVSDLSITQNRLKKLEKELQSTKSEAGKIERELLKVCEKALEEGTLLKNASLEEGQLQVLRGFQFLTLKAELVALNKPENELGKEPPQEFLKFLSERKTGLVELCAAIELEIKELEEDERPEFLKSLGIDRPAKDKLIGASRDMLDLITFFTVKGPEAKAWAIQNGTKALEAAGKIHTDIKRGFIRAEVINFKDYAECNFSMQDAKKKAHLRLEGKEYVVKDGDMIDFKFNV
ncbi:DUF933 domain-containing protein [Candidatus Omnitrophota bacterium]